jgi:hypothetical protein
MYIKIFQLAVLSSAAENILTAAESFRLASGRVWVIVVAINRSVA